jgi:hypothetical protein
MKIGKRMWRLRGFPASGPLRGTAGQDGSISQISLTIRNPAAGRPSGRRAFIATGNIGINPHNRSLKGSDFHGKSLDINHDAPGGSAPPAWASPVFDYAVLPVYNPREIFCTDISEASHARLSPQRGLGWRMGGDKFLKKKVFYRAVFFIGCLHSGFPRTPVCPGSIRTMPAPVTGLLPASQRESPAHPTAFTLGPVYRNQRGTATRSVSSLKE